MEMALLAVEADGLADPTRVCEGPLTGCPGEVVILVADDGDVETSCVVNEARRESTLDEPVLDSYELNVEGDVVIEDVNSDELELTSVVGLPKSDDPSDVYGLLGSLIEVSVVINWLLEAPYVVDGDCWVRFDPMSKALLVVRDARHVRIVIVDTMTGGAVSTARASPDRQRRFVERSLLWKTPAYLERMPISPTIS